LKLTENNLLGMFFCMIQSTEGGDTLEAPNLEISNNVVYDGWNVGSVFGTGRCQICINCIHKYRERKRNLI
jgi:hypothetical protein